MKLNKEILDKFIQDPNDKYNLVALADNYMELDQHTMAHTYYMKCAEACDETDYSLKYHCLMSICAIFWELGNRWKGAIQYARFAKAECPDRPEAYYMESVIESNLLYTKGIIEQDDWSHVYENAKIGSIYGRLSSAKNIPVSRYYKGLQSLYGYYLISLLRTNKLIELDDALKSLELDYNNSEIFEVVSYIYNQLGKPNPLIILHKDDLRKDLQTEVCSNYRSNTSKCGEDILAILCSDSRKYIDFTDRDLDAGSNTLSLEQLGWNGIQISQFINITNNHTQNRNNKTYCFGDNIDYRRLFELNNIDNHVGYLSLDCRCSDGLAYYEVIKDLVSADIITFRHEGDIEVQNKFRSLMVERGYKLLVSNVKNELGSIISDWYIHDDRLSELNDVVTNWLDSITDNNVHGLKLFS